MNPRLQKIRARYSDKAIKALRGAPEDMSADDIFTTISTTDPTPQYKYMSWLMKQISTFKFEDVEAGASSTVGTTLHDFERLKKQLPSVDRSLMRYKDLGELWQAIKPLLEAEEVLGETIGSREAKRRIAQKARLESFVMEMESGLKCVIPLTKAAAQHYGHQTRWCTSAENDNRFESYNFSGPLMILITPEGKKYQIHMEIDNLMSWDSDDSSTILENAAFLNEADKELTARDAEILKPYMMDIIDFINETAAMNIPDQDIGHRKEHFIPAFLELYLDIAQQNDEPEDEEPEDELEEDEPENGGDENGMVVNDFVRPRQPAIEIQSSAFLEKAIRDNKEKMMEEYENHLSDIVVVPSLRGVGRQYANDTRIVDAPSIGLVCGSEDIDFVLSNLAGKAMASGTVILPNEGENKSEFYNKLAMHSLNTLEHSGIIAHCIAEEPSVITDIVQTVMRGIRDNKQPGLLPVFFAFETGSQSDLNSILGNFIIREKDIYDILDTVRKDMAELSDGQDNVVTSEIENIGNKVLFMLTQRTIITAENTVDIARIYNGGGMDKGNLSALFENYVENVFNRTLQGSLKLKNAVKEFAPIAKGLDREALYALTLSEENSLLSIRESATRRMIKGGRELITDVFKTFPELNPDILFQNSTFEELQHFRECHLTSEMLARLEKISFFNRGYTYNEWVNDSSDDVIGQNKIALLSKMVPEISPEISERILVGDTKAVLDASAVQLKRELNSIFVNPEVAEDIQREIMVSFKTIIKKEGLTSKPFLSPERGI